MVAGTRSRSLLDPPDRDAPGCVVTPAERRHAQLIAGVTYRTVVDAWVEGLASHWERRARELEAARPRRGDFTGHATNADLAAAHDRLTAAAAACRARAHLTDLSVASLHETLASVSAGRLPVLEDLERQLRAAITAGDAATIRQLSAAIDRFDTGCEAAA
jgi:hypothetical protein